MARLVGIDLRAAHVRAVLVQVGLRRVTIEDMRETSAEAGQSTEELVRACVLPLIEHGEAFAVALDGEHSFLHRLELPITAKKQLDEILPFELESLIPVDLDDLVYDYVELRRQHVEGRLWLFTAAARTAAVRARIDQFKNALGHEPSRVGCGPAPLVNLVRVSSELSSQGPIVVIDLAGGRTDVLMLRRGELVQARTLLRGVEGLPESASALAGELRQTLAGWAAQHGEAMSAAYLVGGGAHVSGAEEFLSGELGLPVSVLPAPKFDGLTQEHAEKVPRFAKALGLALSLADQGYDLDLRQGSLGFQRGYSFLKEKVPLLSGLGLAILISLVFSTWAELKAIGREREQLVGELAQTSQAVLGKALDDPELVVQALDGARSKDEPDPMPVFDAFDAMVEISKAVPDAYEHDIEEFDMQRTRLKINGVVGTTAEAQAIADKLRQHPCLSDMKVSRVVQAVNSSRQKYVLEGAIRCAVEEKQQKPAAPAEDEEAP